MMIDQAPERGRIPRGGFMGRACVLDLAPLAGRLGLPLIAVFAARDAHGRQALRLAGSVSAPEPRSASWCLGGGFCAEVE